MENELIEKVMQEITVRLQDDNLKKEISDSEYSYGWKMGAKAALAATLGFIEEQRKPKKLEMYAIVNNENRIIGTYDTYEIAKLKLNSYCVDAIFFDTEYKIVKLVEE